MTKSSKATTVKAIKAGTIVVHNYAEFTHGVVVNKSMIEPETIAKLNKRYGRDVFTTLADDSYVVFFPKPFCPPSLRYQSPTAETADQYRILSSKAGFFVSKCKSIIEVLEKQAQYKAGGAALEDKI